MSRKPRKIEFVKFTGEYPYFCQGKLVVKVDGNEVSFGDDCDYPSFVECDSFILGKDRWGFVWDMCGNQFDDFTEEEKALLEKAWNEHAPTEDCGACIRD